MRGEVAVRDVAVGVDPPLKDPVPDAMVEARGAVERERDQDEREQCGTHATLVSCLPRRASGLKTLPQGA